MDAQRRDSWSVKKFFPKRRIRGRQAHRNSNTSSGGSMNAAPQIVEAIGMRLDSMVLSTGRKKILALVTVLCMAVFASGAKAQSGAGSIQGTVTGVATNTKTNQVGYYVVPDLFTGTYTVTVSAPGMKTYSQTIELLVGQNAVINPKLTPGAVTQQVTVAGNAVELVTANSGAISSTLENERISQLPMNGRSLLTLAAETTPGLEGGDRDNGLMPEATEYVADGVPMDNDNFGGQTNTYGAMLPDADSVQEVTFDMTATPAQYATPGTAVLTTKSGTNQIHGSLFETAVNNYWGVAKTRNDLSNYVAPQYIRNEFGASAGGPLVLPWLYHGQDKTFWFVAYERYSLASVTPEQVTVPTMAERNGDFSQMYDNGVLQEIYDPSTTAPSTNCPLPQSVNPSSLTPAQYNADINNNWCRSQFAYNGVPNTINPALESPGAKLLYSITPQPTNSNNPFVLPNLNSPNDAYVVIPTITFRLDHSFDEKNKAFLRYTQNIEYNRALRNYPSNSPATIAANGFPAAASGYQLIPISNFAAALGYTHIFSPTFFAETNLSQQWFMQYVGGGGNPNLDYDKMLGLPNNFGETGFPVINGLTTMNYGGTMYQYQENQIISQIDENLTKVIGNHQLEFGGRIRHDRFYYLNSRNADTTTFTTYTTGLEQPTSGTTYGSWSNTGLGDAGLYLGNIASASVQLQDPPTWFRDMEFDAYLQDNWHATRNLTVNLGFRYEAHPARQTRDNITNGFDLVNHAIVIGAPMSTLLAKGYTTQTIVTNMENIGAKFETAQQAGYPSNLYYGALLTVSPRVGLAWQPFGTRGTVLRGGYGRYIYPVPTRNANPGPTSLPFAYSYTQNYNSAGQSPDGLPNYPLREVYSPGFNSNSIEMGVNSAGIVNTGTTTAITPGIAGGAPGYLDPDFKPDMVTEIDSTIEQPLKGNSVLRLSWVWTHGSYLDHAYYPNDAIPSFVWEMVTGTAPPTGGASVIGTPQQNTYQATALNPYDNTVWGNFEWDEKTGWSNDNDLQVNYQRLFHRGYAYQIFYVWSKAFREGGNSTRDSQVYPSQDYLGVLPITASFTSPYPVTPAALPPTRPSGIASYADWHAMDVWQRYQLDSGIPPQHIGWNYVFDLPVGRGKRFLGNSNRFLNELVGGYQLAGDGSMVAEIFQPASNNWGPISPIHVYKHELPIMDCRSGNCYPEYLWFNGYIAPTANASSGQCTAANGVKTGASGALECVYGLPSNYTPYEQPIDTVPGTPNYNTNKVTVQLANGKTDTNQSYGSGPVGANPYSKTFIKGPNNWNADMSLFKVFPITERYSLRFNMDVFNFLNHQGWNNPNSTDGTETYWPGGQSGATSHNAGRQMQFTLRLSF